MLRIRSCNRIKGFAFRSDSCHKLPSFKQSLSNIFKNSINSNVISTIDESKDLIICAVKGFKPGGDDARPDRGILPFITMLMG